jgi:hypothetical protein
MGYRPINEVGLMIAPPCPARRRWRPPCPVSGGRRVATIIAVIDRVGAMVNTLIRTYMEVQQARERLEAADRRVLAVYKQYQHALKEYGPAPTHGWWRVKLAARPGPCDHCAPLGQVSHRRSLSDALPRARPNVAGTASGRGRSAPAELSGSRNSRM